MDRFKELDLENLQFFETSDLGINTLDVEAMTFAWLAKKRIEKQKIELTSVTGSKPCLMGEVINYIEKDAPQPQVVVAFGFSMMNLDPSKFST